MHARFSSHQNLLLAILLRQAFVAFPSDQPWKVFEPIIEVAFGEGMYWSMPSDLTAQVYHQMCQPVVAQWDLGYTWEWGKDGEVPSCNSYIIDIETMTQRNVNPLVRRDLRVVWVNQ